MDRKDKQSFKPTNSLMQWLIGIPLGLIVLVLFVFLVQPWGEPRESIKATVPKDGDFYDPSTEESTAASVNDEHLEDSVMLEGNQSRVDAVTSRIVDVNLASWKLVEESDVPEDQLPSRSDEAEGAVLVEISSALWNKSPGDLVQFSIPQREDVLVGEVTEVDESTTNIRTLRGTLADGSRDYVFVVTLAETSIEARLNTLTGSYVLFGTQRYGWLKPSSKNVPETDQSLPEQVLGDSESKDREVEE